MFKNVASQSVTLYAVDASTGLPKTGDAANMVFYVSKDDGTVTAISSNSGVPTESDSTNAKGDYKIALSQTETNADKLRFSGKSSTSNIVVVPQTIYTCPPYFSTLAITSGGIVQSDLQTVKTQSVTCSAGVTVGAYVGNATAALAVDASGRTDIGKILGTAVSSPATAGILDVNVKNMNNVAATSITTINANVGTTQPLNFTGTSSSALVKSDMQDIAGSAVSTSSAQIGVNVVNAGGTAWASGSLTSGVFASGAINRAALAADTGLQPARSNTAQAGGSTSITLDASASATDSFYKGATIYLTGGTGAGQSRLCTAYVGSTKVATVTPAWTTNPDSSSTFAIESIGPADIESIGGAALSTSTAQLGVNVVNFGGSAGTFASGIPAVNTTKIGGTSQTAADLGSINITNLNTLSSHDPGATLGTSTLTQAQVTGGSYALNSSSFAFNSAFDFTSTQKTSLNSATPSVTVSDKTGFKLASDGLAQVTTWTVAITGNITGNLSGSVGSVTGAVTLATSQPNYAPSKAGDQMDLVNAPNATAVTAIQSGLATSTSLSGLITTVGVAGAGLTGIPKTGYKLASDGVDAVLIESGISASANLTDDAGSQKTSINLRQAIALTVSAAAAGVLAGAATTTVTTKPAGLPSGNTRVSATVDSDGNRSAMVLKVPT